MSRILEHTYAIPHEHTQKIMIEPLGVPMVPLELTARDRQAFIAKYDMPPTVWTVPSKIFDKIDLLSYTLGRPYWQSVTLQVSSGYFSQADPGEHYALVIEKLDDEVVSAKYRIMLFVRAPSFVHTAFPEAEQFFDQYGAVPEGMEAVPYSGVFFDGTLVYNARNSGVSTPTFQLNTSYHESLSAEQQKTVLTRQSQLAEKYLPELDTIIERAVTWGKQLQVRIDNDLTI